MKFKGNHLIKTVAHSKTANIYNNLNQNSFNIGIYQITATRCLCNLPKLTSTVMESAMTKSKTIKIHTIPVLQTPLY